MRGSEYGHDRHEEVKAAELNVELLLHVLLLVPLVLVLVLSRDIETSLDGSKNRQ